MRGSKTRTIGVLLGYTAISCAYFGWRLLPHPGRFLVGVPGQTDPQIFVWSFAWWPHAILNWINPFFSRAIYAPTGVDLVWVTSVPGLAIAAAPITLLFGASVSYNVVALLLPALSAWTAYLLLRYLTRSTWASVVGGYLYGFSSYELAQQYGGHLHLTAVFLVPLVALVVLRYLRGESSPRSLAWQLGALVGFQAYISTEITLTMTLALMFGLVVAFALVPARRRRVLEAVAPIVVAYGIGAVLAVPLIYYGLVASHPVAIMDPRFWSADLVNLVVPTVVIGLGGQRFAAMANHFPGVTNERDSYLGLPSLLIAVLFLFRRPWTTATRFLVVAFILATFFSLGTALYVNGHRIIGLPSAAFFDLGMFSNVLPSRLALYATLAIVTLVAMWIASTRGRVFRRPYVLPVLAVAALAPPVWSAEFVQNPTRLAFFSDGLYKSCIPRNETLLIFPFASAGNSVLWQAESGVWFKMVDGNLGPTAAEPSYVADPTIDALLPGYEGSAAAPSMKVLLAFARRRHVDRIISAVGPNAYPDRAQMRAFGPVEQVADVLVAPACGSPSLDDGPRASP